MEEQSSSLKPYNLLSRIKGLTRSLLKDICNGQSPVQGKHMISLQRECHAHRLNVLIRVLLIIQKLLQENKHGSKRDILHVSICIFRASCCRSRHQ
ncbi:hypothetical protein MKX01_035034 [Papaver californicum]|nr:hypothetical protein MKX01_035034 [Papaver californicum]